MDTLSRPSWHRQQALLLETETIKHKLLEKPMRVKQGSMVTFSPLSVCSWSRFYLESLCRFVCAKIKMRTNLRVMVFTLPSLLKFSFERRGTNGSIMMRIKIMSKTNNECGWPEMELCCCLENKVRYCS